VSIGIWHLIYSRCDIKSWLDVAIKVRATSDV
jgi:hypothetical protein